jgi:hypothetical protein
MLVYGRLLSFGRMSESLVIGRKTFSDFYRAQARNFGEMTKTTHDAREIEDVESVLFCSPLSIQSSDNEK